MLTEAKTIKAATFAGNEQLGQMLELPVIWNKATAKPVKSAGTGDLYMLTMGYGEVRNIPIWNGAPG